MGLSQTKNVCIIKLKKRTKRTATCHGMANILAGLTMCNSIQLCVSAVLCDAIIETSGVSMLKAASTNCKNILTISLILASKLLLWNEKKVQRQQTDRVLVLSASALNANLHIEMLPFVVSAFLCSLIEMEMKFIDNVGAETFMSANRLLTVFKWMKNEREVL